MAEPGSLRVETLAAVKEVDAATWDRLATHAPPVLEHGFLTSLEDAGCVGPDAGWAPLPLIARDGDGGPIVGVCPIYVKSHSMGEFVYDWSWADAAARARVPYYPKLVIAAPFSPVAGPRLLVDPALDAADGRAVRRALLLAAVEVARRTRCAGLHMLFCTEEERNLAAELGFAIRTGMQFHWRNEAYGTFDDFLGRFRSKRRNQIRRERRRVAEAGIRVRSYLGAEVVDAHRRHAFRFYRSTVDQFAWGRRYLNERFFELLWARCRDRLQLTLATRDDHVLAGTLNLEKDGRRYGRYWGTDERHHSLHFEVCSYAPIDDCIQRGVQVFEAGAGGGNHKYGRGFLPALTWSAHLHLHGGFQEAIADFCRREGEHVRGEAAELEATLFAR